MIAIVVATTLFATSGHALADDDDITPQITVSATGTANVAPDMAVIGLTVLREAETARDALDANTMAMAEVLAAMQAEGIAERDLQTSNFNIQPRYVHPEPKNGVRPAPRIVGYQVSNSLTVRVRDLERLGAILDQSVTLGVNQGGGISFTNDDPSAAITEARTKAMQAAIGKAETLTEAAGIGLGRILTISEQSSEPRPIAMARGAVMEMAADAAPVPVAAGENTYRVSVNVTFELAQ
ncbi:MAG: SIMPL domain-containing protein [Roseitalea sp.]|nr:SIMPL domain-containing protein [Roseitalea sp.]MBO6721966.1 SIMPL domain-containing protein [Roseitalea sp.]MBO6743404.1 SIMPL domain-containing protein [Roseitalea sp.]